MFRRFFINSSVYFVISFFNQFADFYGYSVDIRNHLVDTVFG